MILLKFLRQQDWKYAISCIIFFLLFHFINNLAASFFFVAAFMICYSLKFAGKYNNLFIDQLKLVYYFLYFTLYYIAIDSPQAMSILMTTAPWAAVYLYGYSIFDLYRREQQEKGAGDLRRWGLVVLPLHIFVWASTLFISIQIIQAKMA